MAAQWGVFLRSALSPLSPRVGAVRGKLLIAEVGKGLRQLESTKPDVARAQKGPVLDRFHSANPVFALALEKGRSHNS